MRALVLAALCLGATAVAACHIEDRTPAGSRRDEDAVQNIVARYARQMSERDWDHLRGLFWRNGTYSGPLVPRSAGNALPIDSALHIIARSLERPDSATFDVRVMRTDLRQEGDLAAVWLTLRRRMPAGDAGPSDRDWVEHLVLRRIGDNWRILSVAGSSVARGSPRDPR